LCEIECLWCFLAKFWLRLSGLSARGTKIEDRFEPAQGSCFE